FSLFAFCSRTSRLGGERSRRRIHREDAKSAKRAPRMAGKENLFQITRDFRVVVRMARFKKSSYTKTRGKFGARILNSSLVTKTFYRGLRSSTSSKKARARGSLDWPSQKIACLRTSGLRLDLATWMSLGTPSSAGSW